MGCFARDLNLNAANQHHFGVNTLLTTRMLGPGTQAKNTCDAAQSVNPQTRRLISQIELSPTLFFSI